ncbi:MAG TPA: radical SAM protein [Bacteroidales bacterium]|nr:radical SAM protein [Bacteroidales bacterium]
MYKYLFGPVPSRRLGMSLGVDLVPKKVCSLNCVYCEVGKTTKLTTERIEYVPFKRVKDEIIHFFRNNPDPDFVTFSGSGEPTLNIRLGDVMDFIKELKPDIPIAVLTNGTLLSDRQVRKELQGADIVLPSLDAATRGVFTRINRPAPGIDIDNYIRGLIDFRKEYKGKIHLEIFVLPGYNYERNELKELRKAIIRINPDSVQLNTLDRPGTVDNLRSAGREELEEIVESWGLVNVEIIAAAPKRKEVQSYRHDAEEAIIGMIARRPCTIDDLSETLGMHVSEINKYLDVLESENKIQPVRQDRGVFYKPA